MNSKLQSWQIILISLVLGALTGMVIGHKAIVFEPIGALFIRAIHMLIVPVIFFAIVNAICSVDSLSKMWKLGVKAIGIFSIFMLLSSTLGLAVAYFLKPGLGIHLTTHPVASTMTQQPLVKSFSNILPNNIFESFVSGNIIQILIFSIIFGVALNSTKDSAKIIHEFISSGFKLIIKIAQIVMKAAPIGIFALVACMTGEYGITVILPLIKLVIAVYLGCLLVWVFYAIPLLVLNGKSQLKFFKIIIKPILMAYTTSSSAATLPVTLNCAINELHIEPSIANFLLPLGTSLNLNGLSVYLSITTVFAANFFGIPLTINDYLCIPFLVLGTALGAAAVPGSALIVMGAIQSSLGIPLDAIPLIAAVDRLNDMAQTTTNVVGDLFAAHLIDQIERGANKNFVKTVDESVLEKSQTS